MKIFFMVAIATTIFLLTFSVVAPAATTVRVVQGDSLWAITEATGRGGDQWRKLYSANPGLPTPEQVGNKTVVWIRPGQVLTLPEGWGTDSLNASVLEVVEEPTPGSWDRVRCSLAEAWGWLKHHPWVWGLLGLLGLLGLRDRREIRIVVNNHYPDPPAPGRITVPDCRVSLVQTPAGLRQVGQVRYDL